MSSPADVILLPSRASRFTFLKSLRRAGFPLIPTLILGAIALIAVFANQLAPHNPEVGSLVARFKPPFWMAKGSTHTSMRLMGMG